MVNFTGQYRPVPENVQNAAVTAVGVARNAVFFFKTPAFQTSDSASRTFDDLAGLSGGIERD
jgi:hypothetical protein